MAFDPFSLIRGVGSTLVNGTFGIINQNRQNQFNAAEAQKQRDWSSRENAVSRDFTAGQNQTNRDWQSRESAKARQWEQEMYELYNSPSAMMAQYRKAGINPFLVGSSEVGSAMSTSAPISGSPSAGSPSSFSGSAAASSGNVSLGLDLSTAALQGAESANARAKSVTEFYRTAIEIYKELGRDAYDKFVDQFSPLIKGSDPSQSLVSREASEQIRNLEIKNAVESYGYELTKKFSAQERGTAIAEANQRIDESIGRMQVLRTMSEAEIEKIASDIIVNAAHAFKLKAESGKFIADTATINALRSYVVSVAKADASLKDYQVQESSANFESRSEYRGYITSNRGKHAVSERERISMERNSSALWTALDRLFSTYLKTSVSSK